MSDINLNIPLDLLADAVIHKLDKNSRVRKMVASDIVQQMLRHADAAEAAASIWFYELKSSWDQGKVNSRFNEAVFEWLRQRPGVDIIVEKAINKAVDSYVRGSSKDVVLRLTKEIRADVVTVLRSRLVTLNNEQLVELLKATEVAS